MRIDIPEDVAALFRDGSVCISSTDWQVRIDANCCDERDAIHDWLEGICEQIGDSVSPEGEEQQ